MVGDRLVVEADLLREGHDRVAAWLLVREPGGADWRRLEMRPFGNDRWGADIHLKRLGRYQYTVEAAPDRYGSWVDDLRKRVAAGQPVGGELAEGQRLLRAIAARAAGGDADALHDAAHRLDPSRLAGALLVALDDKLAELTRCYTDPGLLSRYQPELELLVERERAACGAWYEIFVRSQGTDPNRSATFREAERRLAAIEAMGFDVLYLTPIHPIGLANRKGPNNSLVAGPNDPGSPYAIGSVAGGHTAIEPALGTLADFDHFQRAARDHGLELALDLAVQVSPDHPWVTEHPEWFYHRPDGSIRYAENPPKKYEDIYPLNFECDEWPSLWQALCEVVLFWARRGVRIFRVDNPHTKPFDFWRWLIAAVQTQFPDTIFLSEAFTRPKVMQALARAGFSQSYTYFTWRNTKDELTSYLREITTPPSRSTSRQLLHQHAGHPARAVAGWWPAGLRSAAGARRDRFVDLRHLQRLRAVRRSRSPQQRGLPRFGDVPAQGLGLGPARQPRRAGWPDQSDSPRKSGPPSIGQPAISTGRQRAPAGLRQADPRSLQHGPGHPEPGPRSAPRRSAPSATRSARLRPGRPLRVEDLSGRSDGVLARPGPSNRTRSERVAGQSAPFNRYAASVQPTARRRCRRGL